MTESEIEVLFTTLFAEQRHRVFSIAARLTGFGEDAEDLAAETFLQAFRALTALDDEQVDALDPRVWLSAVVVSLWHRLGRLPSGWSCAPRSTTASGPDPFGPLVGTERPPATGGTHSDLAPALLDLAERQAVAVVLRHVAGLTLAEVAEVVRCPRAAAIDRVNRGLHHLRDVTGVDTAALISALAELAVPAPNDLIDRITARWVYVTGPVEDAYVAFTREGIARVMPASTVTGATAFAAAFSRSFGRPLAPADVAPEGLTEAIGTGRATGLRFDLRGRTDFERSVLATTLAIPPGELRPYSWVAAEIERPRAVRAVGTALGHNPVPLLIPCHRVIRSDGTLGQFGSLGTAMKQRLLEAEGVDVERVERLAQEGSTYLGDGGSHLVCMPTCHRLGTTSTRAQRGFRTLTDARGAGFRPCPDCRPVGR
jgi:O-6-methylguanine DNA methyltransferase